MRLARNNLSDKSQTVAEIRRLAREYSHDLSKYRLRGSPLDRLSLRAFYDFARAIPYRMDKSPVEVVSRPDHIIRHGVTVGVDCKKKCILMLAYANRNGIPARIITSSKRADKRHHHIFPQFLIGGQWVNVDATYPNYEIAQPIRFTAWSVYNG